MEHILLFEYFHRLWNFLLMFLFMKYLAKILIFFGYWSINIRLFFKINTKNGKIIRFCMKHLFPMNGEGIFVLALFGYAESE